jgi:integrase
MLLFLGAPAPDDLEQEDVNLWVGGRFRRPDGALRQGAFVVVRCFAASLGSSTMANYAGHIAAWVRYCASEGVLPFPVDQDVALTFLGSLVESGTLKPGSIQPVLSGINTFCRQLGLPREMRGDQFNAVKRGWRVLHVGDAEPDERVALPPHAIALVVQLIADPLLSLALLRGSVMVLLGFLTGLRSSSLAAMRSCDLQVRDGWLWVRVISEKSRSKASGKLRRVLQIQLLSPVLVSLGEAVTRLRSLRGFAAQEVLVDSLEAENLLPLFFRLRGEVRCEAADCTAWFKGVLAAVRVVAPPGFKYSVHSLRKAAASGMARLGIISRTIAVIGGWIPGSSSLEADYIDPTYPSHPILVEFFGQYVASAFVFSDSVYRDVVA